MNRRIPFSRMTDGARGNALVERAFVMAESAAVFTIAGVYASTLGFGLRGATVLASMVAAAVWIMRRRIASDSEAVLTGLHPERRVEFRALLSLLLLSVVIALALPNDVNNTDPAKQVASVEQAAYYQTLLTPGFYSDRGTKYDGWTFLHAAAASATHVRAVTLVRYSKLLLLPCLVLSLYALIRLLGLSGVHVWVAVGLAIVFSGDSFRVISFGGPRSSAYVFQILGLVSLLAAASDARRISPAAVARAAIFLGASAIMHLFFALANALIVGILCALGVSSRARRRWLPAALILGAVFGVIVGPYGYLKSGQALSAVRPQTEAAPDWVPEALRPPASAANAEPPMALTQLVSLRWGEYGSLIPLFLAPLFWLDGSRPRRSIGLYLALFAVPCAAVAIPPVRQVLIGAIAATRVFRILPLSPAVAAIAVYASAVHAVTRSRSRTGRVAAGVILAASAAILIPSARLTWDWYVKVYPSTVPAEAPDRSYVSIGMLLGLGTEGWPPVLASSPLVALKVAAIMNRPVGFYSHGERGWATRVDTAVDPNQTRRIPWEFVVSDVADRYPDEAPCAQRLYKDQTLVLCATERGRASWFYPGPNQRSLRPARTAAIIPGT